MSNIVSESFEPGAAMTRAGKRAAVLAAVRTTRGGRPSRIKDHIGRYWQLWVMALPAIICIVVFAYIPMYGVQLAFREYTPSAGFTGGEWVGLKYFNQFFNNPMFGLIIRNTVWISLWTLVMGFIAPIVLALLINQIAGKRLKSFTHTVTYMPHFISTVVMVSIIQIFLSPGSGILGRLFEGQNLMGDPGAFVHIYWISQIWQHAG